MSIWIGISIFLLVMLGWILYENHKRDEERN